MPSTAYAGTRMSKSSVRKATVASMSPRLNAAYQSSTMSAFSWLIALLRQAPGFQGLGLGRVGAHLDDEAGVKPVHETELAPNGNAAAPPDGIEIHQGDYPLVTEIGKALDLHVDAFPRFVKGLPEPPEAVVAVINGLVAR